MNIQEKLYTALNAVGLVTGRVWPNSLPQDPVYPALTYQFISNPPADTFVAGTRFTNFNAQINCFAADYAGLLALRAAVLLAVEAMPEQIVRNLDIESPYEFETKSFTWLLGYQFRDSET
jgi:hypothetical protein